ncbi:HIRAN domain-containing protein [Globicatella sulfidifaciens]|uniref:HIRAN domain-containing protein n=1 Tax=Globicatella sulfidifaciens TaxID=136093 RepID=A0A7X8C5F2_9LACT|nr:HIRAN domain-containing protein [Globicatella sulfidifaciens]NLJ19325.1 hypothetical protein [Globicatella sulfidifaciens]
MKLAIIKTIINFFIIIVLSIVAIIAIIIIKSINETKKNRAIVKKYEDEKKTTKETIKATVEFIPTEKPKEKRFFKVAGSFIPERQEILRELVEKNKNDYGGKQWKGMSNNEIKNSGKRCYEYSFMAVNTRAELRLDPTNEHDPNAIAVYVGRKKDQMIGYVPREEIEYINKIMEEDNRSSFKFRVGGGRYKQYNIELDKVEIKNDEYNGFVFFHDYY